MQFSRFGPASIDYVVTTVYGVLRFIKGETLAAVRYS